jgi:transposase
MIAVQHWWLSALPVDMRCGIIRLSARVLEASLARLTRHTAYLFRNRSGTRLKVLVWDGRGFWLCARRLERGRFIWPTGDVDAASNSASNSPGSRESIGNA